MNNPPTGPDSEKLPRWSKPVRLAIRLFAIAVIALFIALTVIRLLNS